MLTRTRYIRCAHFAPRLPWRYVAECSASRSSSSRNASGVAFASRLLRVGLFAAFPADRETRSGGFLSASPIAVQAARFGLCSRATSPYWLDARRRSATPRTPTRGRYVASLSRLASPGRARPMLASLPGVQVLRPSGSPPPARRRNIRRHFPACCAPRPIESEIHRRHRSPQLAWRVRHHWQRPLVVSGVPCFMPRINPRPIRVAPVRLHVERRHITRRFTRTFISLRFIHAGELCR